MAFTFNKGPEAYDRPNNAITRPITVAGIGGAASTAYGAVRFFHQTVVKAVHVYVTTAGKTGEEWQPYFSPGATPGGSADVAIGSAYAAGTAAAGSKATIDLSGLTASGALTVDESGYPIFAPGDKVYIKTNATGTPSGIVDAEYETQWHRAATRN